MSKASDERALYVISVAAQRAGMHPQTLRIYERRGLLQPARTRGGNRRYSDTDIARLRRISELTAEGVSVEGIRRIMHLEAEVQRLRDIRAVQGQPGDANRGSLVPLRQSVSVFGQVPSVLRRDRGK
jgi:MerR family transcriptional regulator/heat shock protein HspR